MARKTLAREFPHPRILLTSRIVGYTSAPLPLAKEMELLAFDAPQTESFVNVWFRDDSATAQSFWQTLQQNPQIRGLARIPLLLTLMCRAYEENQLDFPTRRVKLYYRCLRGLMSDWRIQREKRPISELSITTALKRLADGALTLHRQHQEQFSEEELTQEGDVVGAVRYVPVAVQDDYQKDAFSVVSLLVYGLQPESKKASFLRELGKNLAGPQVWETYRPAGLDEQMSTLLQRVLSLQESADLEKIRPAIDSAAKYAPHQITCYDQFPSALSEETQLEGAELALWYQPLEQVGGDFHDCVPISPQRYALLIGDTIGHGLKACLYRHLLQPIPRLFADHQLTPVKMLEKMDAQLYRMRRAAQNTVVSQGNAFATAGYGILCLDPQNRYLFFANAGHPLPLLCRQRQVIPLQLAGTLFTGTKLGMGPKFFRSIENFASLQSGDKLVWLTDGVLEAHNANREQYGPRLASVLEKCQDWSAQETVDRIRQDLGQFLGRASLEDDVTLIVIRILSGDPNGQ